MAAHHPEYLEAIRRNIQLLKKSTDDGLLHAGRDYRASGIPACIHHTFGHAKALTAFLELPPVKTQQYKALPRDNAYGVKYFRDIRTWLVAEGPWRSTCTGFDAEYKVKELIPWRRRFSVMARTGWSGICRYDQPVCFDRSTQYAEQQPEVYNERNAAG